MRDDRRRRRNLPTKNWNEDNREQDENTEINISDAVTEAFHEIKHISTEENTEENENLSNLIHKEFNPEFQYGSENNLNFEILLQQRQRHEAYTSKQLE
ncbi:hypothetical protein GLOIN_2v1883784 [Rhizophagus clarus]|uniref:Uncharacterized protein n=1 Tax=Rhizophagus clarus TaxID=94130 RepID=A0A8H3LE98_9GLOM|nr:hypothetical protein GLOIN_2v1883784 [Rhizophagus clarus]